jgi:hypothetical protein
MEFGRDVGRSGYLPANTGHAPHCYFRDNTVMSASKARDRYRKAIISVILTLVSFFLGVSINALGRLTDAPGWSIWVDDISGAVLLGLVVFVYERRREKELLRKLQVIELMNHHVRNALQPVMYLPYSRDQELQLNTIRDAVQRIDWALREVLPGSARVEPPSRTNAA